MIRANQPFHLIILFFGGLFLCLEAGAQCLPDVPPAVPVYTLGGRTITVTNVSVNGGGAVAAVNPGEAFTVSFNWSIGPTLSACPGCVTFFHFGLSNVSVPGSASATTYPDTHCMGTISPNQSSSSAGSFTAPMEDGFYYITLVSKWVYWCHQYPVDHCRNSIIALIQVGDPPVFHVEQASLQHLSGCDTDDGSISISVDGYIGCFDTDWSGPGGFTASGDTVVSGLAPGEYSVYVSDIGGCDTTLYFTINDVLSESVDLGADTALCTGESLLLDATVQNASYVWQDGSAAPSYLVTAPGTYSVQVITSNCTTSDSIEVDYVSAQPDLGQDSSRCGGSILLASDIPADAYLWQDGSAGETYTALSGGWYWLQTAVGRCSARDSVYLTIDMPFEISLGRDTAICGASLILDPGYAGESYLWQDGSTAAQLTASATALYWVEVQDGLCFDRDSILLTVDTAPQIDLGPDTAICSGNLVLDAEIAGAAYVWQDGSTGATYTVTGPGTYQVTVRPNTSCPDLTDEIAVAFPGQPLSPGISDTVLCPPETLFLQVTAGSDAVSWSDGSSGPEREFSETGAYWVEVSNACFTVRDSFFIDSGECDCIIQVPTAFSPDNDGFNEVFLPFISCEVTYYRQRIYNRWGELVFETGEALSGWNGTWKGILQEMDTYSWIIEYIPDIFDGQGAVRQLTGTVLLFQ